MMKTYHKSIVFSKTLLKTLFRYKDIFQIYPAALADMPSYSSQLHYPLILEYWTTDADNIEIEHESKDLADLYLSTARTLSKEDRILSLLTLVSNHHFFRYTDMDGSWGMPILKEDAAPDEINSWPSKWCFPWFIFPGMAAQLKIAKFSNIDLPSTELNGHISYYMDNPNLDLDRDRAITFPNSIVDVFDAYYSLHPEVRAAVDAAISFIVSAVEIRRSRVTLSLLGAFTAVETMINWEFRDRIAEKCEKCGQLKYGITRKFREYLLHYIGDSEPNKRKFNAFYSLRSKITHTGHLLKNEYLFSKVEKIDRDKDFITSLEVLQLGRLSISNWLILHSRNNVNS